MKQISADSTLISFPAVLIERAHDCNYFMGLKDQDMGLNSANGFLKHAVNNMYGIEI